jgi:hypothetical protein
MTSPCSSPFGTNRLVPKGSCCDGCAQGKGCASVGTAQVPLRETDREAFLGESPAPVDTSKTWVPWVVAGGALAAGILLALAVTRPPRSAREIAAEEAYRLRAGR